MMLDDDPTVSDSKSQTLKINTNTRLPIQHRFSPKTIKQFDNFIIVSNAQNWCQKCEQRLICWHCTGTRHLFLYSISSTTCHHQLHAAAMNETHFVKNHSLFHALHACVVHVHMGT